MGAGLEHRHLGVSCRHEGLYQGLGAACLLPAFWLLRGAVAWGRTQCSAGLNPWEAVCTNKLGAEDTLLSKWLCFFGPQQHPP